MGVLDYLGLAFDGRTPCSWLGNDMTYDQRQREIERRKREEDEERKRKERR